MVNFNFIDFTLIILLALGALNGYRKGFIGSIVGLLGSIIALFLSIKFYRPMADLLNSKFAILEGTHSFLVKHLPFPLEVSTAPLNAIGLDLLILKVKSMALPEFIQEQIIQEGQKIVSSALDLGITTIGEVLTYIVATTLLNGLALVILWFILTNLIYLAARVLGKSLDNTFLGSINRLAGLFLGLVLNALGLMVFFGIFTLFLEITDQANSSMLVTIGKTVNQSVLVPYFKEGSTFLLSKLISMV